MILKRPDLEARVRACLRRNPVTALLGPRQCGKTTLARRLSGRQRWTHMDLENPIDLSRLQNPMNALERLRGVVVLDEVQQRPDLMPILRVLADRRPLPARFLILGSASSDLVRHSSESLAGRVQFVDMGGFSLSEVGARQLNHLWLRGGFPKSFLAGTEPQSRQWREDFLRTFIERDLPQWGIRIPAGTLRRFWVMLAHYHGQLWNASEIGASLAAAHTTVRHYLDVLTGAFVVRALLPWFENVGKRIVKAPKVYIRDSGLLHTLLRLDTRKSLEEHPKYAASWEGFAIEQMLNRIGDRDAYFWATHAGAELDLLLFRRAKRWGFEFKVSEAPTTTKSMRIAISDLKLEHLWIVYPGTESYSIDKQIDCVSLADALNLQIFK